MSTRRIESVLKRVIGYTPINPDRGVRLIEWGLVGALGATIDLSITYTLLGSVHYLLANLCGFLMAVSWNFTGNYLLTYNRPDGHKGKQYLSYVLLHVSTFSIRALTIAALVELLLLNPALATLIGVGVAAMLNFIGTETIFDGIGELWLSLSNATHHIAHVVYSSRIRWFLLTTGLYNPIFRAYTLGFNLLHRDAEREINVGRASATLYTEYPTETVSVAHTLEKEKHILERFIADLRESDTVLDVGANVGVYSCLAGSVVKETVAVEPHGPTAERCRQNLGRNGIQGQVIEGALGATDGQVNLGVTNDAVGTQRPEVAADGAYTVAQYRGDDLNVNPDVVKVDVEGAEHEVLDGLEETLKGVRVVYVETHNEGDILLLGGRLQHCGFDVELLHFGEQSYLRAIR